MLSKTCVTSLGQIVEQSEKMNWFKTAITKSDEKYTAIIDGVINSVASSFGGKTPDHDYSVHVPTMSGLSINVVHEESLPQNIGEYDPDDEIIYIRKGLDLDTYLQVLAHEIAHAIQYHENPSAGMTGEPESHVKAWQEWKDKNKQGIETPEPDMDGGWLQRAYEDQEIELHANAMRHIWVMKREMLGMKNGGKTLDRNMLDKVAKIAYITYVQEMTRKNLRQEEDSEDKEIKRLPNIKRKMLVKKYARRVMSAVTQAGQEIFGLGGRNL